MAMPEEEFVRSIPDGWPRYIKEIQRDQPYTLLQLATAHRQSWNFVHYHTVGRKRLHKKNPEYTFIPYWKAPGSTKIFVWGRDYLDFFGFNDAKTHSA